jgi:hypothetical protein
MTFSRSPWLGRRRQAPRILAFVSGALLAVAANRLATGAEAAGPLVVRTPFQVLDSTGIPVVTVADGPSRRLDLHDQNGRVVASLVGDAESRLLLTAPADKAAAEIGFMKTSDTPEIGPQLRFLFAGAERVRLGRRSRGGYGLIFNAGNGALVGALGQDAGRNGLVSVSDGAGNQRAQLVGSTVDASVKVFSVGGVPIVVLSRTRAASGGGFLQLTDAAGLPVVDAGPNGSNDGVVRTGPASMGVSGLGLPGSYLLGMK